MSNGIYAETSKTNSLEPKNGSDGIGKKPEVGDVWQRNQYNVYVISFSAFFNEVVFIKIKSGNLPQICRNKLYTFLDKYEYTGKAKANINDLFEVEK